MNQQLVTYDRPLSVGEAVARLPDPAQALGWGVQSMTAETVRAMVLLASSRSDHFRYALGVTVGIAQYLYDMPDGAITSKSQFIRADQVGTRIGIFDSLELHVIQEAVPDTLEEEYLLLLVLNDEHQVVGHLLSRLRLPSDHVTQTVKLPSAGSVA